MLLLFDFESAPNFKLCSWCKKKKSLSEFYSDKSKQSGLSKHCKNCHEIRRQQLLLDPEKEKKYKEQSLLAGRKYAKKIREANAGDPVWREERRIASANFYKKNKHRVTKQIRDRYREDKSKFITRNCKRKKVTGSFTKIEWDLLCSFYRNVCLRCKQPKKLTIDHVIPISKGGSNYIINLQPLCFSCNSSKGANEIDYRKAEFQQNGVVRLFNGTVYQGLISDMLRVGIKMVHVKTDSNPDVRIDPKKIKDITVYESILA